jgi:phosphatidyl-myo-inositol dimannoside synthase
VSKKRIILFTTDFPPASGGGILTHSHFLVDALRPLGWEFCVLSEYYIDCSDSEISSYSKKEGFPIYRLPDAPDKISLLKKIWYCYRITRKFKPDVIIGSGRHPVWFAAIVSKLTGIKLVTIGHGTEFTQVTSKNDLKWNRLAFGKSDLLIAISEHTKSIIEKCGIVPKKMVVITNAANESIFKKLPEEEITTFKEKHDLVGKRVILATGALSERKGQKVLIRALPKILEKIPNAVFVAIGIPHKKDEMISLAKQLGVQGSVQFPGVVSEQDLVLWLNACDLFTMTSVNDNGDYEGFGIAVLEAALCGKTAVVSNNGGLPEAVSHGVTGLVVPENDPESTANAIMDLLSDHEKLNFLSLTALQNVKETGTYHKKGLEYHKELVKFVNH